MEKDEVYATASMSKLDTDTPANSYVPKTQSDLGITSEVATANDIDEILGDTPLFTLYMLIRQQLLGFPAYLLWNVSGQKNYPLGTNHFNRK
jgi:hypothetical protein